MTDARILGVEEFYRAWSRFVRSVDPKWEDERQQTAERRELEALRDVVGPGGGRRALDCSCGDGAQAIPLARLGWRVTASDTTSASLLIASRRARARGLDIELQQCDMRDVASRFGAGFDLVISCMALDHLLDEHELWKAVQAMHATLRPGGTVYVRLRNFDYLLRTRPRYVVKDEWNGPNGRGMRLEDWDYESDTFVVYRQVFLRGEAPGADRTGWTTATCALRRRVIRKAQVAGLLTGAGFRRVRFVRPSWQGSPLQALAEA